MARVEIVEVIAVRVKMAMMRVTAARGNISMVKEVSGEIEGEGDRRTNQARATEASVKEIRVKIARMKVVSAKVARVNVGRVEEVKVIMAKRRRRRWQG